MAAPPVVMLASGNAHKAAEIEALVGDHFRLVPRPAGVADPVEDAGTFVGNARLKAIALSDITGQAALADDSGLEVDALGSAPGVLSARFAGPDATDADNVAKLLAALADRPRPEDRRARFRCCVVLWRPDRPEVVAAGTVDGAIAQRPRGEAGFGYDPLFIPDEGDGRTFAEMDHDAKHAISHRGRALRALVTALED